MHYYFQNDLTLEHLMWTARRQEFISYQKINRAEGIADQDWSYASSLLMRYLDRLTHAAFEHDRPMFPLLAVSRKEVATGKHTKRRHRQIIRALGPTAPSEKGISAFIAAEQKRCFSWGIEHGWPLDGETPVTAPQQPARNAAVRAARWNQTR